MRATSSPVTAASWTAWTASSRRPSPPRCLALAIDPHAPARALVVRRLDGTSTAQRHGENGCGRRFRRPTALRRATLADACSAPPAPSARARSTSSSATRTPSRSSRSPRKATSRPRRSGAPSRTRASPSSATRPATRSCSQRSPAPASRVAAGAGAVIAAAAEPADCVMAAIVGAAGLEPTFEAARQGRRLALANKECLVSAGEVFMAAVRRRRAPSCSPSTASIRPACRRWQGPLPKASSASSSPRPAVRSAPGPSSSCSEATPEQALRHPNWSMGAKITIDSATLMNKGLELIEAYHLFPVDRRAARRRHPPAVDRALPRQLHGWLGARADVVPRYAHAHRPGAVLAATHERADPAARPRRRRHAQLRSP